MASPNGKPCDFPECQEPGYCRGLCSSHYKQWARGRELRPIRTEAGVKLPGVVVSQDAATALGRIGAKNLYFAAQAVIEGWARGLTVLPAKRPGTRKGRKVKSPVSARA